MAIIRFAHEQKNYPEIVVIHKTMKVTFASIRNSFMELVNKPEKGLTLSQ
jgi:hypothetical protein